MRAAAVLVAISLLRASADCPSCQAVHLSQLHLISLSGRNVRVCYSLWLVSAMGDGTRSLRTVPPMSAHGD